MLTAAGIVTGSVPELWVRHLLTLTTATPRTRLPIAQIKPRNQPLTAGRSGPESSYRTLRSTGVTFLITRSRGPCLAGAVAKTQYYTAASIDGFIADRNNSLDWLSEAGSSAGKEDRFASFFAGVGAMAMGARTYEWAVEHERLLEDPAKWRRWYGSVPCWVFTHRRLPAVPGADLVFAHGNVRGVHEEMMSAADGRNVWLVGGGDMVGQFADRGLLDEILLEIAPVMLAEGTALLPRRLLASELTLAAVGRDAQFVFLTYQVTHEGQRPVRPG